MSYNIADLQACCKKMADDNRYVYGRWNGDGNNTTSYPSDGYHWDCCTALSRCIRNTINDKPDDNSPLTTYCWPNNDGDPNFDAFLLSRGFEKHNYDYNKARNSGYEFIPVLGSEHAWAFYSTSQDQQFEMNTWCGADIHQTQKYSDAKYMYYPVQWVSTKPDGLQNQAESDGRWAYYKNGAVDTSFTGLAQNINGWWYVANGYVDFDKYSVEQNEYGWWYIKGGMVDFSYTGIARNDFGWWRIENGKVNFDYNGLAQNEYGWWYLKGGKVMFDFNGICSNEYGLWRVVNGQVLFDDGEFDTKIVVKGGMVMVDAKEQ